MPLWSRCANYKMENVRHFILAGCSHTNGSEIESKWHSGSPEKAYGAHIAKIFNASWENISGPGWSNQWIYINLMDRLSKITKKEANETLVIIGWTSPARIPVWNSENNQYFHMTPDIPRFPNKKMKQAHKIIYQTCLQKKEFELFEHSLVVGMQNTLKHMGIKYCMHWSVCPIIPDSDYSSMIDEENFINYENKHKSFWKEYVNNYWDGTDRWSNHAPESYHKIFAEKIVQHLKKIKNV